MAITEGDIAKVLSLVPGCSEGDTVDCLMAHPELANLSKADIYDALHALEDRRQVVASDLIPRGLPPQE